MNTHRRVDPGACKQLQVTITELAKVNDYSGDTEGDGSALLQVFH